MSGRLADKVALITGAASGMGRATALRCAAEGARVLATDINRAGLAETLAAIDAAGGMARGAVGDIADEADVARAVAGAVEAFGGLDVVANIAGSGGDRALLGSFDTANWHRVLAVNLHGPFYACKHALPHLLARGAGAIVNVASAAGVVGSPLAYPYTAAKHGLVGLTKSLALSYGRRGIRVNCICPGITETPMFTWRYAEPNADALIAPFKRLTPLGRFGTAEEIAAAILYLASDEAAFCSGAVLSVDGGYTAQ